MGEQALNIEVVGDSDSCRTNATWLKALAHSVGELESAFGRTGSQSESFWRGAASDAFRGSMSNAKGNASHVGDIAFKAAQALSKFAVDLDTVKSRMNQAKQVASQAGLAVTDNEIQPPDAGPGAAPQAPTGNPSPEQEQQHAQALDQHNAAAGAHQAKVAAFNEISGTVSVARGQERAAHEALQAAVKQHSEVLNELKTYGQIVLQKSVALTGGLAGSSEQLMYSSEKSMKLAVLTTMLRASPTLPAGADGMLKSAQQELFQKAYKDGADHAGVQKVIGRLPEGVRGALKLNASDLTKKALGLDKNMPKAFTKGLPVLKRIPVVGTALTAGFAARDIHDGKDPLKTTESAVGGTAASMGVTAGVEGAVAGAELAGLAVPGPGWVVAGGLALGTAASYGVGYVVDHYGDQINHGVGNAASATGHAIGNAAKGVGHFASDVF